MKRTLIIFFTLSCISSTAQNQISFKSGINPTFMDHQWGPPGNIGTFKGGWGYKAGFDFGHRLNKSWNFFHGLQVRISKYKFHTSNTDYFLNQGFTPVSLEIPLGVGYRFNMFRKQAEVRGFFEWNVGIGGKVATDEMNLTTRNNYKRNIVFRTDWGPQSGSFRLSRFEIGAEFQYEFLKRLSLDVQYSYGLSDRMNTPPINSGKTNGGHSVFLGLSWKLKR